MKIETTIEINKPPSEVYAFLMDEENLTLWIKNFIKLERIQGEDGVVGSTSRHIYDENGKTIEFIEEIIAIERDKLFQSVLRNGHMEMEITNQLLSLNDHATLLKVTSILRPQNLFTKVMVLFSRRRISNRQDEDIHRLKESVEALGEDFD